MKMDFFSLPLSGISDPGMLFSHFSGKGLTHFYFSPKVPALPGPLSADPDLD